MLRKLLRDWVGGESLVDAILDRWEDVNKEFLKDLLMYSNDVMLGNRKHISIVNSKTEALYGEV